MSAPAPALASRAGSVLGGGGGAADDVLGYRAKGFKGVKIRVGGLDWPYFPQGSLERLRLAVDGDGSVSVPTGPGLGIELQLLAAISLIGVWLALPLSRRSRKRQSSNERSTRVRAT